VTSSTDPAPVSPGVKRKRRVKDDEQELPATRDPDAQYEQDAQPACTANVQGDPAYEELFGEEQDSTPSSSSTTTSTSTTTTTASTPVATDTEDDEGPVRPLKRRNTVSRILT